MRRFLAALLGFIALAAAGTDRPASTGGPAVTPPPIAARAYILVDALSGQTLAASAPDDRFEPASLTKLMTAYVVFAALREHRIEETQAVAPSERAAKAAGARMFIEAGKPVTIRELLQGLIVQSGNDAANALAEAVAGSEDAFVQLMNRQAQRLGLANTRFANASGAPAPGHYSSARDLASLALALARDFPDRYPMFAEKEFTYNHVRQANRNRLLWADPTVDGLKTGHTEAAGYCLAASAKRGERRLVAVVLGAPSESLRTTESQKLFNFGFQAYETRRVYAKGKPVADAPIYKGTRSRVALGFLQDVWLTLPRGGFEGIKAVLDTRQPFVAPLAAGEKAGIMKLMRDSTPVAQFPVVALEDVPVAGFLSRGWDTLRLMVHSSP
ncbi:MAG TPA: D-alanyl-D-alanine carboxypeptidase family protein [Usitatibacter sp.]|nr:D-alanyl-D-alanine carboxypeptidase family protein [Usitatibacter sp.]